MPKSFIMIPVLGVALSLLGCMASVGTSGPISVPKDASGTCEGLCSEIGMSLDSVVIMANNVGCVCRATRSPAEAENAGPSTGGGMAALIAQHDRQQQQAQRH